MTKKEMFAAIIEATAIAENEGVQMPVTAEEVQTFCNHEIELLNKRVSKSGGETKKQKENAPIKDAIATVLASADREMTVKEIIVALNMEGLTSQKVSALLSQLRKAGTVKREYDKKVAYFSIGSEDGE